MSKLCPSAQPGMDRAMILGVVQHKCPHFDGADCRLATRVAKMLPPVVDSLPPCVIRKECRWFAQEGAAACMRCPEITTVSYDLSPLVREVSGLPVTEEPIAG